MSDAPLRPARMPAPVARWMAGKSPAERGIAVTLFVAVAAALLWVMVWQPLSRDTVALRLARAANASTLAEARDRVKELTELSRTSAKTASVDARADLDRALAQLSLRTAATSVEWREGRASLVFAAIGYDTLVGLIDALQRDARLRVVEATITARVDPGTVRAELTLAR